MSNAGSKKTFIYVAVGFIAFLALMFGALMFGLYKVRQWGAGYAAKVADPAVQLSESKRILGARQLPDGYRVWQVLPLPFLDTVHLSDAPEREGKASGFGSRGFIFYRGPFSPLHERAYREYLDGKSESVGMPSLEGFIKTTQLGERIRGGKLLLAGGATAQFSSRRANLARAGGPEQAVINTLAVECEGGQKLSRVGVWYSPDPEPGKPVAAADFRGSAADESALSAFLAPFQLCLPKTDAVPSAATPAPK